MDVAVIDTDAPRDIGVERHKRRERRSRQKLLITELFLDFANNTTLHGLRYITEVGLTVAEKIFWAVTFVISLILCFVLIEGVWHKWWYSPVIVSFNERMVSVSEVPFPSVTICPQWKYVIRDDIPYNYTYLFQKYYGKSSEMQKKYWSEDEKQKLEDYSLICRSDYSAIHYATDRNMSDDSVIKNIDEISPQLDMVLESCVWRNRRYRCKTMFKKVYTSEALCYNFNSVNNSMMFKPDSVQNKYLIDSETDAVTSKYGFDSKRGQEYRTIPDLEIILKESIMKNDQSCNSLSEGFKIYLQHPHDMPQTSVYYYAALEGQVSSLAVKFSVFNTSSSLRGYSAEQRQCYFDGDHPLKYFKTYTPSNCRLECLSDYTYKICGCVWFHMPHSSSTEICTIKSRTCVYDAQDELSSNNLRVDMGDKCTCLPRCDNIQYDAEILKTKFDFKKIVNNELKWKQQVNDTTFTDNYSKIEVYFKEPRFVSMRRSELFGLTDFLANCGGLLGLFLGFSFLSLVELFYFSTLRLWRTFKNDTKNEDNRNSENVCVCKKT